MFIFSLSCLHGLLGVTNSHGDQLALLSHHGFESRRSTLNFIQAFFFLFFRTTSLHNFDDLSSAESFFLLMRRSILLWSAFVLTGNSRWNVLHFSKTNRHNWQHSLQSVHQRPSKGSLRVCLHGGIWGNPRCGNSSVHIILNTWWVGWSATRYLYYLGPPGPPCKQALKLKWKHQPRVKLEWAINKPYRFLLGENDDELVLFSSCKFWKVASYVSLNYHHFIAPSPKAT